MTHSDELADIFGVPTDGSNIDTSDELDEDSQEGAYAAVIRSSEETTFEEKAKAVNEAVAKASKLDDNETTNPSSEESSSERSKEQQRQKERDFESIISDAKNAAKSQSRSKQNEQVETQEISEDNSIDESEKFVENGGNDGSESFCNAEVIEQPTQTVEKTTSVVVLDKEVYKDINSDEYNALVNSGFLLKSTSPMFNNFYEMKKATLLRHLPDGKRLPISQWNREMHDAYVDIRININDKNAIADRMQSIQQKRDRVVQIKSIINSQYFLWKRLVPMIRGQLDRVIYEKPAPKQEGIHYEHLRDMEEYFNDLEGIFETSKDILGNLDAAYDNLSRQVTLTGIGPSPEKYGTPEIINRAKTTSVDEDGFDSLDDNSSVKSSSRDSYKPKKVLSGPEEISF